MKRAWLGVVVLMFGVRVTTAQSLSGTVPALYEPAAVKSGYAFQTPGLRAMQDDEFANPGYLWIDKGRELWSQPAGKTGKACATCHGMRGQIPLNGSSINDAATRYPRYESRTGALINLEQQINASRVRHQQAAAFQWESEALLSLTAFVANLANGKPLQVRIEGEAGRYFEAGRRYYLARRGQLNLACTHCHDQNVGRKLRGDTITQGHGNGFPAYRLQWQSVGSLHRRLRNCNVGVRAEPLPYGSPTYLSLELFLAWRANGLSIETPAVRP